MACRMDRSGFRAFSLSPGRAVAMLGIVGALFAPRPAAAQQVVKVGTFTKSTTTVGCPASCTNTVPHGLGVTPTALILWTDGAVTENIGATSSWWAFGVTDGTTSRSTAASSKTAVTTSSASRGSAAAALHIVEFGNVIRATATLQATPWDATNFYLQWTPNNASAYIIHFIAIGGTGVQAKVVEWQATGAGVAGNPCPTDCVSVTGLPFQPTGVLNFMDYDATAPPSTVADAAFT